jgi:acetoin utilization deacetylase AcuC-like enzyme
MQAWLSSRSHEAVKVVYTPVHQRHNPKLGFDRSHLQPASEHAERIETIRRTLEADARFELVPPKRWGTDPIAAVHDHGLLRFLSRAWQEYQDSAGPTEDVMPDVFYHAALRNGMHERREPSSIQARLGYWCFETTTPLTQGSYDAALAAVDTALSATQLVLGGARTAYALCRPPGHHATSRLYGGYCLFNNAAIAAHHVVATTGSKVAILDVDYHHGNGTQEIFYARDDVQYVSLHADPERAYPWHTGHSDETGTGRGAGYNLNIPLPQRMADDAYLGALERGLEAIAHFKPALLIVSLGLDTYLTDPLGDLALTADGFERCGRMLKSLGVPCAVLQEGGYAVSDLGELAKRWLSGLD